MCQEIRIQALYSNEIETSGLPLHDAEKAHSEEVRFNVNSQCQPSTSTVNVKRLTPVHCVRYSSPEICQIKTFLIIYHLLTVYTKHKLNNL